MRVIILKNADEVAKWSAYQIAKKILKFKPTKEKPFVLGLPTGSTPLATYKELINLYNEKILSFENVVTFNMDEYVGLKPEDPQSYHILNKMEDASITLLDMVIKYNVKYKK